MTEPKQETAPSENLFVLVAMLAKKVGKTPLNNRLFIHRITSNWTVVVNGCSSEKGFKDYKIPPGYCLIEYGDYPAALFTPYGGYFKNHPDYPEATEKAFIEALKDAIKVKPKENEANL